MVTSALSRMESTTGAEATRRLFLIWQNPETRQFIRVGSLSELDGGRYVFEYSDGARSDGFHPLVQFPDIERTYASSSLPAFFVNRVMSRKRPSYPEYRAAIGIDDPGLDTPMEVLARTGGPRDTDTFHLVDDLEPGPGGVVVSRFLASGVRHVAGSRAVLSCLKSGSRLELRPDDVNPVNARAQLICAATGEPVAYVPDWLLDDLEALLATADSFELVAERVTPEAHPHLRLLCRIEAHVPPR